MDGKRTVLVHAKRRTVHEVHPDGTSRCGNGLNRPDDYETLVAEDVEPTARPCERCAWIVERVP